MANLTAAKFNELDAIEEFDKLKKVTKDDLVGYIRSLRNKVEELCSYKNIAEQVNRLQRSHVKLLQYNRKDSIEIHGVPEELPDELENTCIDLLSEIGVKVSKHGIQACHRLKNKANVIIKFINRKDADAALYNRGKLKTLNKERFNLNGKSIYINESLCRPYQFLTYKARSAFKKKKISSYNFWKGKLTVKVDNNEFVISHIDDLINLNLATAEDYLSFL